MSAADFHVNMSSFETKSTIIKSFEYINYVVTCYNLTRLLDHTTKYIVLDLIYGNPIRSFVHDLININKNDMPNADLKQYIKWNNDGSFTITDRSLRELYNYTIMLKNVFEPIINEYIATIGDDTFSMKSFIIYLAFPEIKNDWVIKSCFPSTKIGNLVKNSTNVSNYIESICKVIFAEKDKKLSRFHVNIYYNKNHYSKEYLESDEHKQLVAHIVDDASVAK